MIEQIFNIKTPGKLSEYVDAHSESDSESEIYDHWVGRRLKNLIYVLKHGSGYFGGDCSAHISNFRLQGVSGIISQDIWFVIVSGYMRNNWQKWEYGGSYQVQFWGL